MKISRLQLDQLLKSKFLWGSIVWILAFPYIYESLPVRIDLTMDKSLPYIVWGTYEKFDPKQHDYAMFTPTVDNRYTKKVKFLVKEISCREGEKLTSLSNGEFFCDGKYLGKANPTDKDGNHVDFFHFDGKIPKGSFFMMGTHERSYDSRYFGFVPKKNIVRGAKPIW